jgi:acetylornithine/N-succinyldiaminopimelate aminotransferase
VIAPAALHDALLGVYRPADPLFARGEGSYLFDEEGRAYLDMTSGLGVNALGYGDAAFAEAVRGALEAGVAHTSNLFRTRPAAELAAWLAERSFAEKVFFCNSGAEANEGAVKFARRWAMARGGAAKHEVVALSGGFHGRTAAALALTDRPAIRDPFAPLWPGVRYAPAGDAGALRAAVSGERTAAVIAEPVQAEGGVHVLSAEYLREMRQLCDEAGALLILDEVQVGLGRTGTLWAHETAGITPDLMTLAKPLAGGLPMGAVLVAGHVADALRPGDHGSTFGGGALVASAALAVCERLGDPDFLARVRHRAAVLGAELERVAAQRPDRVRAVRGAGLIRGVEISVPAADVVRAALEAGVLLCTAGENVVRFLPPLTASVDELRAAVDTFAEAL